MTLANQRSIDDVIRSFDERAPLSTAESWDNVGLLVGDSNARTTGAVISIDLTLEAIEMAIQKNYHLIITHHPCVFPQAGGLDRVVAGSLIYHAIRNGISVVAWHTNFDRCALEVVKAVSSGLKVKPLGRFQESVENSTNLVKSVQSEPQALGYGFWGEFPSPRPFPELAEDVKSLFGINGFWITNPVPSQVTRVGFVAGKGSSFVEAASQLKLDLLITGEAGYHTALAGMRQGVAVMELGHRESERFFVETIKIWLTQLGLEFVSISTPTQKIWLGGQ